MQTFTFKDMDAIRTALRIARTSDLLPTDAYAVEKALLKIDDVTNNYCVPRRYIRFAFLPMLAKRYEE